MVHSFLHISVAGPLPHRERAQETLPATLAAAEPPARLCTALHLPPRSPASRPQPAPPELVERAAVQKRFPRRRGLQTAAPTPPSSDLPNAATGHAPHPYLAPCTDQPCIAAALPSLQSH